MLKATARMFRDMFTFRGRLTRPQFWWGYLGWTLLIAIFTTCIILFNQSSMESMGVIISVLIFAFFMKYVIFVAAAKRIADAGYPWYLIFMYFFPVFGQIGVIILLCLPTSDVVLSK